MIFLKERKVFLENLRIFNLYKEFVYEGEKYIIKYGFKGEDINHPFKRVRSRLFLNYRRLYDKGLIKYDDLYIYKDIERRLTKDYKIEKMFFYYFLSNVLSLFLEYRKDNIKRILKSTFFIQLMIDKIKLNSVNEYIDTDYVCRFNLEAFDGFIDLYLKYTYKKDKDYRGYKLLDIRYNDSVRSIKEKLIKNLDKINEYIISGEDIDFIDGYYLVEKSIVFNSFLMNDMLTDEKRRLNNKVILDSNIINDIVSSETLYKVRNDVWYSIGKEIMNIKDFYNKEIL